MLVATRSRSAKSTCLVQDNLNTREQAESALAVTYERREPPGLQKRSQCPLTPNALVCAGGAEAGSPIFNAKRVLDLHFDQVRITESATTEVALVPLFTGKQPGCA